MARLCLLFAAGGALVAAALTPAGRAAADALTVLHSFTGKDGAEPLGGVIFDADSNLYGTTNAGGAKNFGAVYKLTPNGQKSVLHSFSLCPGSGKCVEGNSPQGPLAIDASSNLIGTAAAGGASGGCVGGTVFAIAPDETETILHAFCPKGGRRDGEHPRGGVVMDGSGNLYGITSDGGANGNGAVYQLLGPDYTTYNLLYSFCSQGSTACTDGALPAAGIAPAPGLAIDGSGNLYGTTSQGGRFDSGEVFELSPTGSGKYHLTVLYSFCPKGKCADGDSPTSGLLLGNDGNLYGTTTKGGTGNKFQGESAGVIFQVIPNGQNSTETVLYNFCSQQGCADGAAATGSLIMDSHNILYGAAAAGGAKNGGVVFSLAPDGAYTVLYDFCSKKKCADGQQPMAIANANGDLFGTTAKGGAKRKGTVFEIAGAANP
jgi:uncharacterized repeat protein (TIGR03803 family)